MWRASARSGTHRQSPAMCSEVIEIDNRRNICGAIRNHSGGIPYRQQLREGADAASTLLKINQRVDDIWRHEKNGGFYPVDETDLPEDFI